MHFCRSRRKTIMPPLYLQRTIPAITHKANMPYTKQKLAAAVICSFLWSAGAIGGRCAGDVGGLWWCPCRPGASAVQPGGPLQTEGGPVAIVDGGGWGGGGGCWSRFLTGGDGRDC